MFAVVCSREIAALAKARLRNVAKKTLTIKTAIPGTIAARMLLR
jgi:hypothetical protein